MKFRAAYGQSANFPCIRQVSLQHLVPSNIGGLQGSIVNIQGGDPNIKPERQTEFEAGFDFSILNSRLNFEFTFYNKKIFDFLLLATVPPSSGFSTKYVNAGDLRNQGIEIGLNAQPISSKNIKWNSTVNFWMNRSNVTRLTIPPVMLGSFGTSLGTFQIEQGKSATQIVGTDAPAHASGLVVLGNQEPKFQMNTFNEITLFNKLSLRFLIHWKYKGDNVNLLIFSMILEAQVQIMMLMLMGMGYLMDHKGSVSFLAAVQEDLFRMQVTCVSGRLGCIIHSIKYPAMW